MIHSKTESKDLKLQKMQGHLNSVGTILNVTNKLLGIKNNENLAPVELRENLGNLIHGCIDAIAIMSHVNKTTEQNH